MNATVQSKPIPTVASGTPRRWRRPALLAYFLAIPILLYEVLFILYPIYEGIWSSFHQQVSLGAPGVWVGLDNYRRMWNDQGFWNSMQRTLIFMVLVIVVSVGFGLFSALVLNRAFRFRSMARGVMTLPWAFPEVPAVLIFLWMLNPNFGVMNVFAGWLPWVDENPRWLLDPTLAMASVVMITAWKGFPFYSLVILAALQTVPQELGEAARVDGASKRQIFLSVTLPSILPTLLLLVVLAAIYAFKQFTIIWLLTGSGPSGSTDTIVIRIYQTAFRFYDFTYASTIGAAGFVMAFSIALLFLAIQRRQEMDAWR
jgi:multiple sugar transport system permease protein